MATTAQFTAPQGAARSRLDARTFRLRRTSQEPTRMATVAQFAPPQGSCEVPSGCAYSPTPPCLPGAHEFGDIGAVRNHPRSCDVSAGSVHSPAPPCLPGAHESGASGNSQQPKELQ
eukprot:1604857-Pyramimonas_sp.AAC.1